MKKIDSCFIFLKKFDQYGIRPSLYFKGQRVKGSSFGCCLTTLLFFVFITCFIYFGQNLYYRKSPILSSHEEYVPIPEPFKLDPEITPILIELNSPDGTKYYTDPEMITAKVSQFALINQNYSLVSYDMEICNETHIRKIDQPSQEYFRSKNLSNFFCVPLNIKNLTMEGAFDQPIFQTIKFSFSMCANSEKKKCKDKQTIISQMRRGYIGVYFLDIAIDSGNFKNPKKIIPKEVFSNYVLDFQKEIDIYYQNNYLISEEGLIFDQTVETKMVNYQEFQELNFMVEDEEFLQVYFKLKQIKTVYERAYTKIQDLLGLLGGFLNFFYLFGYLLNFLYVRVVLISDILLDIFTIKICQKKPVVQKLLSPNLSENISNQIITQQSPRFSERLENKAEKRKITINLQRVEEIKEFENQENSNIVSKKEIELANNRNSTSPLELIGLENDEIVDFPEINLERNPNKSENQFPNALNSPNQISEMDFRNIPMGVSLAGKFSSKKGIQEEIKEIDEVKEIENIKLGFLDYVYYYSGFFKTEEREKKKLMISKGNAILQKFLDVKFIIQKFYEIEKLKQLMLSESQIDLFNLLPKPEILINFKGNQIENSKISKNRHSIHTKVLKRSNSSDENEINRMSYQQKQEVILRNSLKKNKMSKKLTYLAT